MTTAEQIKALSQATEALNRIERTVRSLVCVQLVNTIYGRIELRNLRSDYQELRDADHETYKKLNTMSEQKTLSDSPSETEQAMSNRRATMERIDVFEEAHPLVAELYHATTRSTT